MRHDQCLSYVQGFVISYANHVQGLSCLVFVCLGLVMAPIFPFQNAPQHRCTPMKFACSKSSMLVFYISTIDYLDDHKRTQQFLKDFWTPDGHHQAPTFTLLKCSKVNFQASHSHFFNVGGACERAQHFQLFFKVLLWIFNFKNRFFRVI